MEIGNAQTDKSIVQQHIVEKKWTKIIVVAGVNNEVH